MDITLLQKQNLCTLHPKIESLKALIRYIFPYNQCMIAQIILLKISIKAHKSIDIPQQAPLEKDVEHGGNI